MRTPALDIANGYLFHDGEVFKLKEIETIYQPDDRVADSHPYVVGFRSDRKLFVDHDAYRALMQALRS